MANELSQEEWIAEVAELLISHGYTNKSDATAWAEDLVQYYYESCYTPLQAVKESSTYHD